MRMKLWGRIVTALSVMFMVSMLTGVCLVTALAAVETETEAEYSTVLDAPGKAWWSSSTLAVWKSVKPAKQYQVKLYEVGGLESAVVTVKVSSTSYDFSYDMVDGKEYYFMVRSVPTVSEQQTKAASDWTLSLEGDPVTRGDTTGKWRYYIEGNQYEKADRSLATGWLMIHGSWYLFNDAGYVMTDVWMDAGDHRYYLAEDGKVSIGWLELQGHWYYFNQDGHMMTGWISGSQPTEKYYLYPDGTMAYDTEIDSYVLNSNGLTYVK